METPRHQILGQLELSALIVEWGTMWSGLMIFLLDESNPSDQGFGVALTVVVVVANTVLLICFVVQFIRAKIVERTEAARLAALQQNKKKKASFLSAGFSALSKRFGSSGEVELTSFENPMQEKGVKKKIKKIARDTRMKKVRKKLSIGARVRRTSEGAGSMGGEVKMEVKMEGKTVSEGTAESIHVDAKTGRRYSYNTETNETKWLAEDDEQGGATQGETKNHGTKRKSFRKIDGGEEDDYFVNVETGEAVWYVPEDGEEVSW